MIKKFTLKEKISIILNLIFNQNEEVELVLVNGLKILVPKTIFEKNENRLRLYREAAIIISGIRD